MWQRAKPQLQVEVFTKAKKNNVNINFVIKDQYFSYFHGIQDAVNEFSCLLIGMGFCLPKFLNMLFEINVNIALWLTFSHQSFQKSRS